MIVSTSVLSADGSRVESTVFTWEWRGPLFFAIHLRSKGDCREIFHSLSFWIRLDAMVTI